MSSSRLRAAPWCMLLSGLLACVLVGAACTGGAPVEQVHVVLLILLAPLSLRKLAVLL